MIYFQMFFYHPKQSILKKESATFDSEKVNHNLRKLRFPIVLCISIDLIEKNRGEFTATMEYILEQLHPSTHVNTQVSIL